MKDLTPRFTRFTRYTRYGSERWKKWWERKTKIAHHLLWSWNKFVLLTSRLTILIIRVLIEDVRHDFERWKKWWERKAKIAHRLLWSLLAVVVSAVMLVVFLKYSEWQDLASKIGKVDDSFDLQLKAQQENVRTGAQILGGLALLGSLFVAIKNMRLAEDGKITDRFAKAVEQLGSDKLEIRLGGIYALERIARDSVRDHPQVMEVLTAFVRENSSRRKNEIYEPTSLLTLPVRSRHSLTPKEKLDTDIQAILAVIGRRKSAYVEREKWPLDLSRTYLSKAFLQEAHLEGAHLEDAHLGGADLKRADLREAHLWQADLKGAFLVGAYLGGADLEGAHLKGAYLVILFCVKNSNNKAMTNRGGNHGKDGRRERSIGDGA